jgi:hypothetical protein
MPVDTSRAPSPLTADNVSYVKLPEVPRTGSGTASNGPLPSGSVSGPWIRGRGSGGDRQLAAGNEENGTEVVGATRFKGLPQLLNVPTSVSVVPLVFCWTLKTIGTVGLLVEM